MQDAEIVNDNKLIEWRIANESVNEQMIEWTKEWMNERICERNERWIL